MPRRYWLFKSDPESFGLKELQAAPNQTTGWDGVRNYQARNFLRDQVQVGDGVLFYHSVEQPAGVVALAEIVTAAHPDPTAFMVGHKYHDPKSDPLKPTWFQVELRLTQVLPRRVTLPELKATPGLEKMGVVQKGSRLSVQPVTLEEWDIVLRLAGISTQAASEPG